MIIDQFIASAETKWRRLSGLVLLLPHGFEGHGARAFVGPAGAVFGPGRRPQHPDRQPTTPAQYFHCLRRQVLRPWRKPLVVMTPKSLLRHPRAVSPLDDCSTGRFQRVIPDAMENRPRVDGVLLCSGKIYYELEQEREELGRQDVAIVRLEQLYPLPMDLLKSALAPYPDGTPVYWVQEEPENMGAWRFLLARLGLELFDRLPFSGIFRRASPSPATGSASSHKMEQKELLMQAFACI